MASAAGNATAGQELTCPQMPPYPARSNLFEDQQPGTNIDISADPSSARMPTSIDTNAEPVLSLLYLLILFSFLLSRHGAPLPASPSAR